MCGKGFRGHSVEAQELGKGGENLSQRIPEMRAGSIGVVWSYTSVEAVRQG